MAASLRVYRDVVNPENPLEVEIVNLYNGKCTARVGMLLQFDKDAVEEGIRKCFIKHNGRSKFLNRKKQKGVVIVL